MKKSLPSHNSAQFAVQEQPLPVASSVISGLAETPELQQLELCTKPGRILSDLAAVWPISPEYENELPTLWRAIADLVQPLTADLHEGDLLLTITASAHQVQLPLRPPGYANYAVMDAKHNIMKRLFLSPAHDNPPLHEMRVTAGLGILWQPFPHKKAGDLQSAALTGDDAAHHQADQDLEQLMTVRRQTLQQGAGLTVGGLMALFAGLLQAASRHGDLLGVELGNVPKLPDFTDLTDVAAPQNTVAPREVPDGPTQANPRGQTPPTIDTNPAAPIDAQADFDTAVTSLTSVSTTPRRSTGGPRRVCNKTAANLTKAPAERLGPRKIRTAPVKPAAQPAVPPVGQPQAEPAAPLPTHPVRPDMTPDTAILPVLKEDL